MPAYLPFAYGRLLDSTATVVAHSACPVCACVGLCIDPFLIPEDFEQVLKLEPANKQGGAELRTTRQLKEV